MNKEELVPMSAVEPLLEALRFYATHSQRTWEAQDAYIDWEDYPSSKEEYEVYVRWVGQVLPYGKPEIISEYTYITDKIPDLWYTY